MADYKLLTAGCLVTIRGQVYFIQYAVSYVREYLLCIQQCISAIGFSLCLLCPGSSDPKFGAQHFEKQCQQ